MRPGISAGFRVALASALLFILLSTPGHGFGELGLAGALPPGPAGRHRNPALAAGIVDPRLRAFGKLAEAQSYWMDGSTGGLMEVPGASIASRFGTIRVPVGLLGLFRPVSNPFLYLSDKSRFIASFDMLAFVDQIAQPGLLLLDPSRSAEDVVISISSEEITVTGGSGEPIRFGARPGTRGISRFATPLIPPPFLGIMWTGGPLLFETGLFWGGGDYTCTPNEHLDEVLSGDPVKDETEYSVLATASVQGGVSQSAVWLFPLPSKLPLWRVQAAVRAVLYYTAAAGRIALHAGTRTGIGGSPETVFAESGLFYFYPGKGFGLGGRIDAGIAATSGRILVGLGVLNLIGVSRYAGLYQAVGNVSRTDPEKERLDFAGSLPEAVLHAAWTIETGPRSTLILLADVGYPGTLAGHIAASFRWRKLLFESGLGWEGAIRYDASVGLLAGKLFFELGMSARQATFSHEMIHGLGLAFGRHTRKGK